MKRKDFVIMKKLFSMIFAVILSLSLTFTNFAVAVQADDLIGAEYTVISEKKEIPFTDDRVLVVLTREASMEFNTYTADDFVNIGCASVTDLSNGAIAITKAALNQAVSALSTREVGVPFEIQEKYGEAVSNYKQILCLNLENPGYSSVLAAIETLRQRDDVYYAGPNYIMQIEDIEDNILSPADIGTPDGWAYDIVQMDLAYRFVTDLSSVSIGIMDTGIDGDHPYLQSAINVSLCRDFTNGSAVITGVPTDDYGHGTKVAGIIAAQGGGGVYSICSMAQIVSLKVGDSEGVVEASDAIAAIDYATLVGIDVLNASFSIPSSSLAAGDDQAFVTAISRYPGVIVCAAGNDNSNNDSYPLWPSCYPLTNIISVGASTEEDQRWVSVTGAASNYGINSVDVFAPGGNFKTTIVENINDDGDVQCAYVNYRTSYATPIVAGIAGLILAQYPNMSATDVRNAIVYNVDESNYLDGLCVSGGRVNAFLALASVSE